MSKIKDQYEYITWQIQSLTDELSALNDRMEDRERQLQEQQEQEQQENE